MKERAPRPAAEIAAEVVDAFAITFLPRFDLYAVQLDDGRFVTVRQRLSLSQVSAHFQGSLTLAAYALDAQSRARWLCFDADEEKWWDSLRDLAGSLASQDVPTYLEQSRRGGHLWLFFAQPLPGRDARRFGRHLLGSAGITSVEVFPKQDHLATGPGSLVRLPLGVHRKTGQRYPFICPDGSPLAPTMRDQVALLAYPQRVPGELVSQALAQESAPEGRAVSPSPLPSGQGAGETLAARVKDRITVYDFVSQYVDLDERGRGHCPFHDDAHKSFSVDRARNFWHCFAGCGGGSLIDFWMRWRAAHGQDADFRASLHDLAQRLF